MLRAVLLFLLAATTHASEIEVCYNYGCATEQTITLSRLDLFQLRNLFRGVKSPESERISIGMAVGLLNTIAGAQTPIYNDRGGNADDDGLEGRMDCIDHSTTATRYLRFMRERHLLRFHEVGEPVHRAPWVINEHWAARIEDKTTGEDFAVDAWFFDNGQPAAVVPLPAWMKGWDPD